MSDSMTFPAATGAAVYEQNGDAATVLSWRTLPLPQLGAEDVLVEMECAAIHPSDFGMIAGTYGRARALPAIAGREAVGRVVATGPGVRVLRAGDRVRMPTDAGVWTERGVYPEYALLLMPNDLAPEAAAQSFVNAPAAVRVLEDFVTLKPGDLVVQNAGNSAVGRAAAFYARRLGVRLVSLVRNPAESEKELMELGAEAVLADDDEAPAKLAKLKGDSRVRLALNSVGGLSVMRLLKMCDDGATLVTFGGMTGEKVRFPTRELIFRDITLRGFWLDRWVREARPEDVAKMNETVWSLWRAGLPVGVERTYPVAEVLAAVAHAARPGRSGKIMLVGPAYRKSGDKA